MCVVSMVMDHYRDKWGPLIPIPIVPFPVIPYPYYPLPPQEPVPVPFISPAEIEEFRRLLERAREYDKRHNEPDCELEEKREAVRKIAKALGLEIDFV